MAFCLDKKIINGTIYDASTNITISDVNIFIPKQKIGTSTKSDGTFSLSYLDINDPYRGAPPPILRFFAFGHLMFHNIPVVVRSFNFDLNPAVDYIDVGIEQTEGQDIMYYQRVPTQSNLFLDLQTQYLPGRALSEWHIEDFAKGNLVKKGFI